MTYAMKLGEINFLAITAKCTNCKNFLIAKVDR